MDTFDLRRRCLYLTYYSFGDTRKRGMALLQFTAAYRVAGFELAADELPDHLAMLCEFTAGPVRCMSRLLRLGSPLFHSGILLVIGGHLFGILIPEAATNAVRISEHAYHVVAVALRTARPRARCAGKVEPDRRWRCLTVITIAST